MRWIATFAIVLSVLRPADLDAATFVRGDANADETVDVSDAVTILLWLTGAIESTAAPIDAFDGNDDGRVDVSDAIWVLHYLLLSGPPPPAPFPVAGFDETPFDEWTDGDMPPPPIVSGPDLAPKSIEFDADGTLRVVFANEGTKAIPEDTSAIDVFVDGHAVRTIRLGELANQSFRQPGAMQVVDTGVRVAGESRRIGIVVDPDDELAELNEFQNTLTRTVTRPTPDGVDLVIRRLALSESGELRVVVANEGTVASKAGLSIELDVSVERESTTESVVELSRLAPGAEATVAPSPVPRIEADRPTRVRVSIRTSSPGDEIDSSNDVREAFLPEHSTLDALVTLLDEPAIRENLIWEGSEGVVAYDAWSSSRRDDLRAAFEALESGARGGLDRPPALDGSYISAADAWTIFVAHASQSLHVEVTAAVSWSLLELDNDALRYLFDGRRMLSYNRSTDRYRFLTTLMGSVTAWDPRIAFEFLSSTRCVRDTQLETIVAFTDWCRGHLIHTASNDVFSEVFGYSGLPPVDRVLYSLEGKRHKTAGCWGTSGLYAAVLRAVNIPVRRANTRLGTATHSRPEFVSVDRSMPHGDDPYNTTLLPSGSVVPSTALLYTGEEMNALFLDPELDCDGAVCNSIGEQASFNAGQRRWLAAFVHRSDSLLYQYTVYGSEYLDDSLRGPRIGGGVVEYARPYFSESERAVIVAAAEARLREIGGGDIESGKLTVRTRYGRFGSNK